jgi:hypothetical protein
MDGDGVGFRADVPQEEMIGDTLEYVFSAESEDGLVNQRSHQAPIVHGFQSPHIESASGPAVWTPSRRLAFRFALARGEYARAVCLHYRVADQNAAFRTVVQAAGRSGGYELEVDPAGLDDAYELIYYFEVLDLMGGGSFFPDPFRDARYYVCRPL